MFLYNHLSYLSVKILVFIVKKNYLNQFLNIDVVFTLYCCNHRVVNRNNTNIFDIK